MKSIKVILYLLTMFAVFSIAKPAIAQSQHWCFQYEAVDHFDDSSEWNPWNNSQYGTIIVGPAPGYGARSSNTAAVLSFTSNEPSGSFLIIDKTFDSILNIDHSLTTRFISKGCAFPAPPVPLTRLLYCSANIWIKPNGGAQGYLQFTTSDYTYLTGVNFNFPATNAWIKVSIANTTSCNNNMIVRLGINKVSYSAGFVADDLDIEWVY